MTGKARSAITVIAAAIAVLGISTPVHADTPTAKPAAGAPKAAPPGAAAVATGVQAAEQATTAQVPVQEVEVEDAPVSPDAADSSTEQGQTHLDESFGVLTHAEWVRDTRRQAWQDTKWDMQARSYYLTREKFDTGESEAWAVGGHIGMKTGYFRERFAFGATAYASAPLHAPDDKDGTTLLKPGQEGYSVLGELYGEFLFNEEVRMSIGRRAIDTPYINRNDNRMTPNTFEQIAVQGLHAGDGGSWRWGAGYFDRIKERNSDDFVSMAADAGAPDGVERGVYAAGANWTYGDFSLGAIDYYSDDIINIFYTETKYSLPLSDTSKLSFALQYTDEAATGDELLKGRDFESDQWGGKADLSFGNLLLTAAFTSAGGDSNMQNPWSGYPGYTSVQVEDFNRDGEDAWLLRAGYNFAGVPGMSVYGLYVDGSQPDDPAAFSKDEYDLNFQWAPPEGSLKGLMVRLRYAHVTQDDAFSSDLDDLRIMVYYDPPAF